MRQASKRALPSLLPLRLPAAQLLPSLYAYVGRSLHATPTQLGTLTLARALVQALASPLAGATGWPAHSLAGAHFARLLRQQQMGGVCAARWQGWVVREVLCSFIASIMASRKQHSPTNCCVTPCSACLPQASSDTTSTASTCWWRVLPSGVPCVSASAPRRPWGRATPSGPSTASVRPWAGLPGLLLLCSCGRRCCVPHLLGSKGGWQCTDVTCFMCEGRAFQPPACLPSLPIPSHPTCPSHLPHLPAGLSLLIPAAQSVTADYHEEERRGRAFGLLYLTGTLGALTGAVFATNVGHLHPLGIEGWRFAFATVAVVSWLIGLLAFFLGTDPRVSRNLKYRCVRQLGCGVFIRRQSTWVDNSCLGTGTASSSGGRSKAEWKPPPSILPPLPTRRVQRAAEVEDTSWRQTARDVWEIVTIPTFLIIILQASCCPFCICCCRCCWLYGGSHHATPRFLTIVLQAHRHCCSCCQSHAADRGCTAHAALCRRLPHRVGNMRTCPTGCLWCLSAWASGAN